MTPTKLLIGQILVVFAIVILGVWTATQWAADMLGHHGREPLLESCQSTSDQIALIRGRRNKGLKRAGARTRYAGSGQCEVEKLDGESVLNSSDWPAFRLEPFREKVPWYRSWYRLKAFKIYHLKSN
jgi:hypothetical protein